jgi:hypothetical protein
LGFLEEEASAAEVHRYHGVFAPNHRLRKAVTSLAIGNVGKRQEAATGGHTDDGSATGGCCDANPNQKPRSYDTSRIAWAKLMARVGEEFPLECPACGGDIRLIAFITDPGPIRKILTPLGRSDTFPRLKMCPGPLPKNPSTPFVHGLPVRDGRSSAFKAYRTAERMVRSDAFPTLEICPAPPTHQQSGHGIKRF